MCALFSLWAEDHIQQQLDGVHRNKPIYVEIAEKMHEQGHTRDYKQCQEKLKNLKTEYKKAKDENNRSGHGLTTWKFMEEMDGVLGTRHTTRPTGILESMPGTGREREEDSESENESESSIISPSATVASPVGAAMRLYLKDPKWHQERLGTRAVVLSGHRRVLLITVLLEKRVKLQRRTVPWRKH